jgi:uncharacterized protein YjgD (DUF1641 family)
MESKALEKEIAEIHHKLNFITDQMKAYQQRQREIQELKEDFSLIAKDVFDAAVEGLEDVAPYFDSNDLIHLLKKLLRNTKNLNRILTQLESAEDLFSDLQPLGKQMFDQLLETLNELDQKGYFEFFKESVKIVDTIVTSFSVEDVRMLRENITPILLTIKSMTQPEMLSTVDNALGFFRKMDITVERDISYFQILKELRNPEVKRGMIFMLEFVKNMAKPNNNSITNPNKETNDGK